MKIIERRVVPVLACLVLLVAACGQKPGVHVAATESGGASTGSNSGGLSAGDEPTDLGSGDGGAGTGDGSTSGGGTSGGSSGGGATGGGGASTGSAELKITGKDRTGASASAINLAVHAPVTGAAPLPAESFEKSNDLYWRHLIETKGEKVLGRSKVNVAFKDDKYTPNTAIQACRELSASAFLLVGAGGTDQIQACGALAGVSGFPYFSPGVTEAGLETATNPWYFAGSMSYKQQGVLLAAYIKNRFGNAKVGAIITQTPNFEDAVQGWQQGVQQYGINLYKTARHSKGDTSWYNVIRDDFIDNGVEVVYALTAPIDYIRFAQAYPDGAKPQFVGVGVTKALNAVLGSGCPDVDGGEFFSPFPGLDVIDALDPDFNKAAARFNKPKDDLALALWSLAKIQDRVFTAYEQAYGSTDLTREDLRRLMETQTVKTNLFPDIRWSANSHFGGTGVHVLKADCAAGIHKTIAQFKSTF